eukprot:c30347_g1_i1.p1 GENE.c30347_g1_i1~~c30347_g1_i1.p1  ORF type:complete len:110 (+),score=18.59 c30347_g1_i1:3-332(+)
MGEAQLEAAQPLYVSVMTAPLTFRPPVTRKRQLNEAPTLNRLTAPKSGIFNVTLERIESCSWEISLIDKTMLESRGSTNIVNGSSVRVIFSFSPKDRRGTTRLVFGLVW